MYCVIPYPILSFLCVKLEPLKYPWCVPAVSGYHRWAFCRKMSFRMTHMFVSIPLLFFLKNLYIPLKFRENCRACSSVQHTYSLLHLLFVYAVAVETMIQTFDLMSIVVKVVPEIMRLEDRSNPY